MNWKQIIYTAAITLFVTIASGIFVNWYTKNSIETNANREDLIYEIQNTSNFQTDSLKISLYAITLTNIGNEVSRDIKLQAIFNDNVTIIDANGKLERTKEVLRSLNKTKNTIEFRIPNLYAEDKFALNIVLDGIVQSPEVVVQSEKTIGKINIPKVTSNKKDNYDNDYVSILLTVILLIPILYILNKLFKKPKGYITNINNNAFLFLHNNQLEFSKELLEKEIKANGGSSHELANLALVKFMSNDNDTEYESLLSMAAFISNSKRGDFIINFNKLIISAKKKDYLAFRDLFLKCVVQEKKELKKYIDYSSLIVNLKKNDSKIQELLDELIKTFYSK